MELMFETKSLSFWELVTRENLSQEETAELIVPDSFPDIGRIVDSWAQVLLRSKECRTGSISVSGTLQAGLLFAAEENEELRRLECSIPFSIKVEHDALSQQSFAEYTGWVKSVDARMLNSRKAMIRVNLCSDVSAWEKANQQIPTLKEQTEDLQCRRKNYAVLRTFDMTERSIALQEEAELPQGLPAIEKILDWTAHVRVHECKTIGSRMAFRGNLETEVFYQGSDQSLNRYTAAIPVTQYVEMNRDVEGMIPAISLCVTGRDLQMGESGRRLYLNLNLLAQAWASAYEEMQLLEDLYSTKDRITPSWAEIPVTAFLDGRVLQQQIRETVSVPAERVERAQLFWDAPMQMRQAEQMTFTLPMRLQLLCRDAEGVLQEASAQLSAEFGIPAADNCSLYAKAGVFDLYVSPTAGGVEVRCNAELTVDSLARQQLQCVNAATRSERAAEGDRPSILVRRMEEGESIWSIAKACAASVSELLAVNHMQEEDARAGTLLLIPMQ